MAKFLTMRHYYSKTSVFVTALSCTIYLGGGVSVRVRGWRVEAERSKMREARVIMRNEKQKAGAKAKGRQRNC